MPTTIDGGTGVRSTEINPDTLVTDSETIAANRSNIRWPTTEAVWQLMQPYVQTIAVSGAASRRFSGIPAGINRVKLLLDGVSTTDNTGTGDFQVRIGTGGSVLSTGYDSTSTTYAVGRSSTTGFLLINPGAAGLVHGHLELERMPGTNRWKMWGHTRSNTAVIGDCWSSFIDIGGPLDTIDFLTGAGTLDAGSIAAIAHYF